MPNSPAHKFGQIIGDALEAATEKILRSSLENLKDQSFFLDKKGKRAIRKGQKLSWSDNNGNQHDLDFVIERGGSDNKQGIPCAFIECAWRRYTKHSRNKAQEIQGAIVPLFEKYKKECQFIGVVLAGEFTENSLRQMRSLGFQIVHISYQNICSAFKKVKIDAAFNEKTSNEEFLQKINTWEQLNENQKTILYNEIYNLIENSSFVRDLLTKLNRHIVTIRIWTMAGELYSFTSVNEAKEFVGYT